MKSHRILLIDNFDSFTYNLVDFFSLHSASVTVQRNTIEPNNIDPTQWDLVVISPGPGVPKTSGNLMQILGHTIGKVPIFGVCLGQEAVGEYFGAQLEYVEPVHGRSSQIIHDRKTIFSGLEQPFSAGRYHSLALAKNSIPSCLEVSASTEDGVVMALRHRKLPVETVQFHPESVLTMRGECGLRLVGNVVNTLCKKD